ncbi:hypothetical protein LshimejAT787_0506920 [Lyophyllum shimeji]|uniref:Uncharacterized protein n=1 Tax=Lyophyllum shimeji TaxID=47721 RepID=A0A9P3PM21_LYOSH|nr:hypothetical protein LshimejAT787_0506920 [Lyophyllum shimeji]
MRGRRSKRFGMSHGHEAQRSRRPSVEHPDAGLLVRDLAQSLPPLFPILDRHTRRPTSPAVSSSDNEESTTLIVQAVTFPSRVSTGIVRAPTRFAHLPSHWPVAESNPSRHHASLTHNHTHTYNDIPSRSRSRSAPSAVFIYSPRSSIDDTLLKAPLSPTSSLKGVFVRSRPTSAAFSDYEFPGIGELHTDSSPSPSPFSTDEESSDDAERWVAHAQTHDSPRAADARSIAPSTYTTTSRMRIVRRSDADMHAEEMTLARALNAAKSNTKADKDEEKYKAEKEKEEAKDKAQARRRTWPSYKAIRKTVSNILHRRDPHSVPVPVPVPVPGRGTNALAPPPPIERIKPSSASLFSRRRNPRRRATTTEASTTPVTPAPPKPKPKLATRAQLRRSRSFSGFTNVLSAIGDDDDEPEEEGEGEEGELDEATAEARQLVAEIRRRWAFEDVDVADADRDGYLFERAVERPGPFRG